MNTHVILAVLASALIMSSSAMTPEEGSRTTPAKDLKTMDWFLDNVYGRAPVGRPAKSRAPSC